MPTIGNTLHGVDLNSYVTKDFSLGRGPKVGRGERSPSARGSTRFSSSTLRKIKLSTIGRPENRATRITEKSLRTASRAVGEALGALAHGDILQAAKWMGQASLNLKPMLDPAILKSASELSGSKHTPQEVENHILMTRLGKHLGQMDEGKLFAVIKLLKANPPEELGSAEPLLREALVKEAGSRIASNLGAIRQELANPVLNTEKVTGQMDGGVMRLINNWTALKGLKGEPLPPQEGVPALPFALESHLRMKLLSELTDPGKIKLVAQSIEPSRLAAMAKGAQEPLLGALKEVITDKLMDRMSNLIGPLATLAEGGPEKIAAALDNAYSDYSSLLKVAQQMDAISGDTTLAGMLKGILENALTSAFEKIATTDGRLESIGSRDLSKLMEIGGKAGINLEQLPTSKINIKGQASAIAQARIESSYPEVHRLGQVVLAEMKATPIHLDRMWTAMNEFRSEVTRDFAHHHRILDPSMPLPEEGDGEIYAGMVLDHISHFDPSHPRSNANEALDILVPDVASDSVKQLPYRTADLEPDMLAHFSTAEITRLHYILCTDLKNTKYKGDDAKQQLVRNQNIVEEVMLNRKLPMVNTLLANHAVEASLSIVTDQGKNHIMRLAQLKGEKVVGMTNLVFSNFLMFQGMGRFCRAFDPYFLDKPETHHVGFNDDRFEASSRFFNATRDEAAEKAFPGGKSPEGVKNPSLTAEQILEASWAGRGYLSQLT